MKRHAFAAAALLLLLCALPASSPAQPKGIAIAPPVALGDTLPDFGRNRAALGISASDQQLFQARVAGYSLSLRVHGEDGDPLLFEEDLSCLDPETKALRLSLSVPNLPERATLQIDQRAVDLLKHVNVEQIVIADGALTVKARYALEDIIALREGLSLASGELLCLSGEDGPVTVVSEDGVRRQIGPQAR